MYTTNTFTIMKTFINTTVVAYILLIVAYIIVGLGLTSCTTATAQQTADSIAVYNEYFDLTEKLLDEIEVETGWSTSYADNGREEECDYYTARYALTNTKGVTLANTLELHKVYFKESQKLLNMLEEDYNWLDGTGEGDLYSEWVEVYKKIHK